MSSLCPDREIECPEAMCPMKIKAKELGDGSHVKCFHPHGLSGQIFIRSRTGLPPMTCGFHHQQPIECFLAEYKHNVSRQNIAARENWKYNIYEVFEKCKMSLMTTVGKCINLSGTRDTGKGKYIKISEMTFGDYGIRRHETLFLEQRLKQDKAKPPTNGR